MSSEERLQAAKAASDVDELLDLGNQASDAGDEVTAERCFRPAAALGSLDAEFNLGNALARQGRYAEALVAFHHAAAGGVTGAALNAGFAHEDLEQWEEAAAAFRQAAAEGDPQAALMLGQVLRWHGHASAGEAVWREAAAGGDPWAAGALARWLLLRQEEGQDVEDVEPLLRQAMAVDDDARSDLGHLLRRRGALDEAEQLLRHGVDRDHPDSMIKLALLLEEERGDLAGAEAVLRRAGEVGEVHAHNNLGVLLRDRGQLLEAEQAFMAGATSGDELAARNLRAFRRTYRRQLGRAYRRRARSSAERPE